MLTRKCIKDEDRRFLFYIPIQVKQVELLNGNAMLVHLQGYRGLFRPRDIIIPVSPWSASRCPCLDNTQIPPLECVKEAC